MNKWNKCDSINIKLILSGVMMRNNELSKTQKYLALTEQKHLFGKTNKAVETLRYAEEICTAHIDFHYAPGSDDEPECIEEYKYIFKQVLEFQNQNNVCFICKPSILAKLNINIKKWYDANRETVLVALYDIWSMEVWWFIEMLLEAKYYFCFKNNIFELDNYIRFIKDKQKAGLWI